MGELLSATSKSENNKLDYPYPSIPDDLKFNARILQHISEVIGITHYGNYLHRVELFAKIYWLENFGILHTEWYIKNLNESDADAFYKEATKLVELRTVRLVSNISKAGKEAADYIHKLLPIVDLALSKISIKIQKESTWEELVQSV